MTNLGLSERREADRRETPRREAKSFRVNWTAVGVIAAIAIAALSWAGNGAKTAADVASRITTLETQRQSDSQRLDRIEDKIDRLLERQR